MDDVIKQRGALFLGSRLKRLAERMQGDVVRVAQDAGLAIQPSQYPLLATLDAQGPHTVGELAQALELSQPSVTRLVAGLAASGLVSVSRVHRDQRQKTVALTEVGRSAVERSKLMVWPRIETAVAAMLDGLSGPLLGQIGALEALLAERSLDQRSRAQEGAALAIREFSDDLAGAFHDINAEWIESMYRLEPTDREVLENPRARIIDPGGAILFVEAAGVGIIGTCALQKTSEGCYELTKMGVRAAARGGKAGAFLLRATIERALRMEATLLYLLSNRKSAAAIHLYEKLGFVHDEEIMRIYGSRYARCDVAMRYRAP